MKKIFLALLALICLSSNAQSIQDGPIAQLVGGTTNWLVTQAELSTYLTQQLNQNEGFDGTVYSATIIYQNGQWFAVGVGYNSGVENSRSIRLTLKIDGNGYLTFDFTSGGTTESCVGDPCLDCQFAANGNGCDPCKRTTTSQSGIDGVCNHIVSREKPVATSGQ